MSQLLAHCPTCGTELTSDHLFGLFLRCPSCNNDYMFQGGVVSEIAEKYYASTLSWEDFLRGIFDTHFSHLPEDMFTASRIIYQGELNVPYVDVVYQNHESGLVPTIRTNDDDKWDSHDIPEQLNSKYYLQCESHETAEAAKTSTLSKVAPDLVQTSSETATYSYVGREIMYIPMKMLKWEYGNQTFCFIGHSDGIVSTGACLPSISPSSQGDSGTPLILTIAIALIVIALIVSAWMVFMHPFVVFHGFWKLFLWANGYKCLFHFLGALVVIGIGTSAFCLCGLGALGGIALLMPNSTHVSRQRMEARRLFHINF